MTPAAMALLARDPAMRRVVAEIGPCTLEPRLERSPYESLVRAIAHQQLHGKAAETILGRFTALYAPARFPKPAQVLATPVEALRGVGFSAAKALAVRDVAEKTERRVVPTRARIARMTDAEIVERLTQIRGVGVWTVEMLLIFQLGREDVLPVDDFGVRNGYRVARRRKEMPTPKEVLAWGERFRPHRTTCAWYLWRAADRENARRKAGRGVRH